MLVVAGLALGASGACGGEPDGVGFGGAPPPSTQDTPAPQVPGGPVPPSGGRSLPAEQIDASALPESYPRLVWTQENGSVLGAYGQEGGCSVVRADLVEETSDAVHVRFVEVTPTTGPCTMDLRFPPLTVPLAEPLGDRTVVLMQQAIGPPGR